MYLTIFGFFLFGCNEFEKTEEIKNFLKNELNTDTDKIEVLNLFVLQYGICGASTEEILSFIYSLDNDDVYVVVGDVDVNLIKQLHSNMGEEKVLIDKNQKLDRYGLRFANDIFVSFKKGEIGYWTFVTENKFNKIRKCLS